MLILLDRDGTLVREVGFPKDPKKVHLLAGTARALQDLHAAGYRVVVVTNQSGVGRGLITRRQMHSVNRRFLELLKASNSNVDGLYWCPHAPQADCECRKPKLKLVKRAARKLKVSWKGSISVGDRPSDVELGQRTGGKGVLVLTGYGRRYREKAKANFVARTISQAAAWIIKEGNHYVGQRKTR